MSLSSLNTKVVIPEFPEIPVLGDRVARSINTVYQAETDGFISYNVQMGNQGHAYLYVETDDATPDIEVSHIHGDWGNAHIPTEKLVKKGDYYKIDYAGAGIVDNIFWCPVLNT